MLGIDEERLLYLYVEYDDQISLSQTCRRHREIWQELRTEVKPYSRRAFYRRHDGQEWTLYVKILRYDEKLVYYQTHDYGYFRGRTWPLRRSYHYFFSPDILRFGSAVYSLEHTEFQKTYAITRDAIPFYAYFLVVGRTCLLYIPLYTMLVCMSLILFLCIPILLLGAIGLTTALLVFFYETTINVPDYDYFL